MKHGAIWRFGMKPRMKKKQIGWRRLVNRFTEQMNRFIIESIQFFIESIQLLSSTNLLLFHPWLHSICPDHSMLWTCTNFLSIILKTPKKCQSVKYRIISAFIIKDRDLGFWRYKSAAFSCQYYANTDTHHTGKTIDVIKLGDRKNSFLIVSNSR